jgi:hypothetical protein
VQFLTNTKDIKDVGRNNLTKKQNQKPIRWKRQNENAMWTTFKCTETRLNSKDNVAQADPPTLSTKIQNLDKLYPKLQIP